MSSPNVPKKPKDANALFKKFNALSYDEKIENFKKFLNDFYEYENKEIPLELDNKRLEMAYAKIGFERDKAYMRVLLLGQLIDDGKLKQLLPFEGENAELYNNKTIYQKIVSLKNTIEALDKVTSLEYPDLCKYIVSNIKNQLYDNCHTRFNICEEITKSVDSYISENRLESSKINLLSKNLKDIIYIQMNEKFHSVMTSYRFNYVERPENFQKNIEAGKANISSDDDECLVEEEENSFDYEEEDEENVEDEEDKEDILDENFEEDSDLVKKPVNDTKLENIQNTTKQCNSQKRSLNDDSEVQIIGYGKSAKFSAESSPNKDEVEYIVISDED